jgi:hypothetical protein
VVRPFAATGSAPAAAPVAVVGQQPAPVWALTTVTLGDVTGPVTGAALGYPLLLCLSPAQQQVATAGSALRLDGPQSRRTYRLHADATSTPRDLVVANCATAPPTLLRAAGLVETATSRALDAALVRQVTVWGPDTNPAAIPADRMQVELVVSDPQTGPNTLILADGTRWSATSSTPVAGGLRLGFLVPLATSAQDAGWEVTAPDTLPGLLPLTLPAPTSRAALLRERLQVAGGAAQVTTRDGVPLVTLALTLTLGPGPELALLPDDVLVTRADGGARVAVPWTPPTLVAGTPVTVELALPRDRPAAAVEVALAAYRARVRW